MRCQECGEILRVPVDEAEEPKAPRRRPWYKRRIISRRFEPGVEMAAAIVALVVFVGPVIFCVWAMVLRAFGAPAGSSISLTWAIFLTLGTLISLIGALCRARFGLRARFRAAGVLVGRSKADVVKAIGREPNSWTAAGPGRELLQWMESGYHICLVFQDGVCEGVTHESAV